MNRNEVEQWMKESLGSRDYAPSDESWKKLQEAITPPANKNYLLILGALPAGWKAAATVALLVSAGSLIYLLNPDDKKTDDKTVGRSQTIQSIKPAEKEFTAPQLENTDHTSPAISASSPIMKNSNKITQRSALPPTVTPVEHPPHNRPLEVSSDPPAFAQQQSPSVEPKEEIIPKTPVNNKPDIAGDFVEEDLTRNRSLIIGVAAQAGKASVGDMRYQVGIVAHKNILGKFYAKATVAVASTSVYTTQQNTFQSISVNSMNSVANSNVEEKSVEAQYGRNVISLGISPNIGYNITSRLALSAGLALYRNLDQSLSLRNENEIDPTAVSNNVIDDSKSIGKWDAGVTGNASYNVSKKLAVDVQYRYGLSNYMYVKGQAVRNSGVSMGLNYMFGQSR